MKAILYAALIGCTTGATTARAQEPAPSPQATQTPTPESAQDVSARSLALDVAGAFTNDGYRIRDGFWPGTAEPGRPQYLQVNVFAGNEYWFCAAATQPARKVAVSVYSEDGQPVDYLTFTDGNRAAAGFEPDISGRYFVRFEVLEGEKAPFCLVYAYK